MVCQKLPNIEKIEKKCTFYYYFITKLKYMNY